MTDSFTNDFDGRREFDFDVDVTTGTDADNVSGDAVVRSTMVLVDKWKVQNVALVDRSVEKTEHG